MNCHAVAAFGVEVGEEVICSGHHLEVVAVAVPGHVDVPAVVGILNDGESVFAPAVAEDTFCEVMDCAEVVDEICHFLFCFKFNFDLTMQNYKVQDLKNRVKNLAQIYAIAKMPYIKGIVPLQREWVVRRSRASVCRRQSHRLGALPKAKNTAGSDGVKSNWQRLSGRLAMSSL